MSSPENTDRPPSAARDGQDVLANLPRTRPQRSTPRRAAARRAAGAEQAANAAPSANGAPSPRKPGAAKGAAGASRAPATGATAGAKGRATSKTLKRAAAKPAAAGAAGKARAQTGVAASKASLATAAARPRRAPAKASTGTDAVPRQGFASDGDRMSGPVAPPGGAEFLATAAEIVNELAKAGLSSGGRLFKDVLSRLPLS
jgi:hypothetical protein